MLKARKEYLADLKIQSEKIQLFIDTEKKFGTSTTSTATKKKTKVVTKKRERNVPSVEPLGEDLNTSGYFSLQPSNSLTMSGRPDKESSLTGINEESNPNLADDSSLTRQYYSQTPKSSSAGKRSSKVEAERELEVDDFY